MQFDTRYRGNTVAWQSLKEILRQRYLQSARNIAYADYCRSAATPGARCRDCHGTIRRAVDIAKTEQWGELLRKSAEDAKASAIQECQQSAAYRAVTMLIPNLTQPTVTHC